LIHGICRRVVVCGIYYWISRDDTVYMLVAYPKSRKDGLTREETAILAAKVKEL